MGYPQMKADRKAGFFVFISSASRCRRHLRHLRIVVLGLAVLLSLTIVWPARAADMFGRAESPPVAAAAPVPAVTLPAPLGAALGRVLALQSRLNAELRGQLQLAREGVSWRPAMAIIFISFLYGVLHAVGPGHGKVVVGSYFVSRRARLMHGIAMSGSAALVQSVSAVLLVGLLAAVLQLGSREILAQAATLETLSYGVITGLGLWMAWGSLRGRACCALEHDAEDPHHAQSPLRGEPDHQHGPACCHHHHPHDEPAPGRHELAKVLATGAAVGLRPCSGAILVLLFTLANQIFAVGVVATFAMGLGVAITVAAVSLATLGVHRSISALGEGEAALAGRLHRLAAFGGAMVITLFGALQLLGILTGAIVPMAG